MPFRLQAVGEINVTDIDPTFDSLDAASAYVEAREAAGTWPDGQDAVATDTESGRQWIYTEEWEPLD